MWSRSVFRRFSSSEKVTFGKHLGKTYDEVIKLHPDYVQWMKKQTDISPTMREFLDYAQSSGVNTSSDSAQSRSTFKKPWKASNYQVDSSRRKKVDWPVERKKVYSPRRQDSISPVSGSSIVTFGKHEGMTYQDVFARQQGYCKFLMDKMREEGVTNSTLPFILYCQQRWLQPSTETTGISVIEAPKDCLEGRKFALTGNSMGIYSRLRIEACLTFFGATVVGSVSSRCNALLLVSQEAMDGRNISEVAKYVDAVRKNVEIVPLTTFLERLHDPGDGAVSFNLG